MALFRRLLTASAAAVFSASAVEAQTTRPDTPADARVVINDTCVISKPEATENDYKAPELEFVGPIVGGIIAGLVGDAVKAGVSLAGDALTQASQERSFSASGITSFDFYRIGDGGAGAVEPVMKERGGQCLILSVPRSGRASTQRGPAPVLSGENLDPDAAANWNRLGLPDDPAVYVEAELQRRPDGFVVRPVLVWYAVALPGAPQRALPSELHVTFATPGLATDQAAVGTAFAVARVRLPEVRPGAEALIAPQFVHATSPVVPIRPLTGSADEAAKALSTLETGLQNAEREVVVLRRSLTAAQAVAARPGAKPEAAAEALAVSNNLDDAKTKRDELKDRLAKFREKAADVRFGSTNVLARFLVVRDANAFGEALGKALKERSTSIGSAVTTALTPETPQQAWTALDTTYVTAMSTVELKTAALEAADLGGDVNTLLNARLELRNARAAANAAAAASGRPLPFTNIV